MTALLKLRNLQKSFNSRVLLDIEEFAIDRGECVVLSGRNGAGKTTLLKILAGLEPPDRAECFYDGIHLTWRAFRSRLQTETIYLHQTPYMFDRSVADNVAYGLCHSGKDRRQRNEKVHQALEWAGLAHLADRNARLLSGGEKQRVALTRARVLSPRLLLLDEPMASMDVESREQTIFLIRRLRSEMISTVVTTHEPQLASLLGNQQRHLCMTGPRRKTIVKPFLYDRNAALGLTTSTMSTKRTTEGRGRKECTAASMSIDNKANDAARRSGITAVILAGGKARRMAGQDKGLIEIGGKPMIEHIISAVAPQVSDLIINANRNKERYESFGYPVVPDIMGEYYGPLVGMASALKLVDTPYLLTIPCDSPLIALELAEILYAAICREDADVSVAHDGERMQPVFALLKRGLLPSLLTYLESGGRKIDTWYAQHKVAMANFSGCPDMFLNVNTPEDLALLRTRLGQADSLTRDGLSSRPWRRE